MRWGRIFGYGIVTILLGLGLIFFLATGAEGNTQKGTDLTIGLVLLALGTGILALLYKSRPQTTVQKTVVQNIELPGDIDLEKLKCNACGATLDADAIAIGPDGAAKATCPYCGSAYTLREAPKW